MSSNTKLLVVGLAGTGLGFLLSRVLGCSERTVEKKSKGSKPLAPKTLLGGIELGGTSICVTIAEDTPTNVIFQQVVQTTTPDETLPKAVKIFEERKVAALGIASFGPVDLNTASKTYGYITATPKEKWRYADVVGRFQHLGIPLAFQTDVNAPALAEVRYGQHGPVSSLAYVTVGTGIGVGIVIDGKCVTGILHPEGGHIRVAKLPSDDFAGCCPFHGDCLEGLCAAGALGKRLKCDPSELKSLPDDHKLWDLVAYYLAQLCATLALIASPEVIVLGGGVLKQKSLFPKIRAEFKASLKGYLQVKKMLDDVDHYIVPSIFNESGKHTTAGAVGALTLAYDVLQ